MKNTPQTSTTQAGQTATGLSIRRYCTSPGEHPFDAVEWELRDARIGHGDKISFEQRDVEFPNLSVLSKVLDRHVVDFKH